MFKCLFALNTGERQEMNSTKYRFVKIKVQEPAGEHYLTLLFGLAARSQKSSCIRNLSVPLSEVLLCRSNTILMYENLTTVRKVIYLFSMEKSNNDIF